MGIVIANVQNQELKKNMTNVDNMSLGNQKGILEDGDETKELNNKIYNRPDLQKEGAEKSKNRQIFDVFSHPTQGV